MCIAWRMAARSTIAGTPVKSWWITRPGVKEISREGSSFATHSATAWTCSSVEVRSTFSSRIFSGVYGSRSMSKRSSGASRKIS